MNSPSPDWHKRLPVPLRAYLEAGPVAALLLGISSGFPYAMLGATLTTRLAQDGIDKKTVTAFSLAFLVYNLKVFWAPAVDRVRLPWIGRFGQRCSWLWLSAAAVAASVAFLGLASPTADLSTVALAAILVGVSGATFDIVIDAYRIETLQPHQLATGSGMSQYGWRIGSVSAGALALMVAGQWNWTVAYLVCMLFALPAVAATLWLGEPARHRPLPPARGVAGVIRAAWAPMGEFFGRRGAALVLLFVLVHKIGDTLGQLTLRLLLNDLAYTNAEIAKYDVGFGFLAYLIGIFIAGALYVQIGLRRSLMLSLLLMAASNLSFALLAQVGHSNAMLAFAIAFENIASGIGGVVVVAYLSALCNLSFTATQFALLSAAASVVGRLLTGTTAGALIESLGYVDFYLLTTVAALPGIAVFALMMRAGLVDETLLSQADAGAARPDYS